LMRVHESS